MNQNLKTAIKREYVKCVEAPQHFMRKYCTIQHPKRGKMKFDLYDYQDDMVNQFKSHRYNIILKSRQLGISTLSAGYALWMMLFNADKNILVIAKDKDTAKNLVTKVRVMYHNLPQWLKTKLDEDNKLSLRFSNGSQIKAVAATAEAGRSEALSLLVLDEAAFIEHANSIWTAAQQTLATGGDCITLSTPNGVGNWFHRQWVEAVDGVNGFNTIKLHWTVHPERDEVWRKDQDRVLGPSQAAQECDADFLTSGQSVVDPQILQWYKENQVKEPVEKSGFDRNLWIWEYPNYSKDYIVVADVARGDGTDFSGTATYGDLNNDSGIGNDSNEGFNVWGFFQSPTSNTVTSHWGGTINYSTNSDSSRAEDFSIKRADGTAQHYGIKYYPSGGSFAEIGMAVYGIRKT